MPVFATSVIFGVFAMPAFLAFFHWNLPAGQYFPNPVSGASGANFIFISLLDENHVSKQISPRWDTGSILFAYVP